MKKEFVRQYNFSDADLKQLVDSIISSARRDIAALETRGIDLPTLNDLQTENDHFADLPTDEELIGNIAIATEKKDTLRQKLEGIINTIRTMAKTEWGLLDARYRCYSFGQITQQPDNTLLRTAKRTLRTATGQLSSLATQGLTAAMLANLQTLIIDFDNAIDTKEDAEKDREVAAQTRILAGNAIYKKTLRISTAAKDIWYSTNAAKYKDYLIQRYVRNKPQPLNTYKGNIAANSTQAIAALAPNVQKIIIKNTTTDLLIGLSADELTFNGKVIAVPAAKRKSIAIKNFASTGNMVMIKNESDMLDSHYKMDWY